MDDDRYSGNLDGHARAGCQERLRSRQFALNNGRDPWSGSNVEFSHTLLEIERLVGTNVIRLTVA